MSGTNTQPVRLYSRGVILGHRRGKRIVYPNTSLLAIEGVRDTKAAEFYFGKRVAYIYKVCTLCLVLLCFLCFTVGFDHGQAKTERNNSKYRVIWGKVTRSHGSNGVVRAKFTSNLPPKSFGARVRVMLYPSRV